MSDREKLIELLWEYDQMRMMRMSIEECADRLVPKGLTVQQWIPVTECLPQEDKPMDLVNDLVQVLLKSGAVTVGFYQRQQKTWYVTPECMSYYAIATEEEEVRAWRPLAEPQKGE